MKTKANKSAQGSNEAKQMLTEDEKWKTVCEIVVQHALLERKHVSDTIELLKSKFNLA